MKTAFRPTLSIAALGLALVLAAPPAEAAGVGAVRSGPIYSSSDSIRFAQRILEGEGYLGRGSYTQGRGDEATLRALKAYQRDHYLRPNGMLDPSTMGTLTSHDSGVLIAHQPPAPKPAAPAVAPKPAPEEKLEMTSRVTEETPAPAKEAVAPPKRTMPKTGSPAALPAVAGAVLLAAGLFLVLRNRG